MIHLRGMIPDFYREEFYAAELSLQNDIIESVRKIDTSGSLPFILPGFIDSHIHIESSLLPPSEFARLAVIHGTVATVSDPHEIANVCGLAGVQYMLENGDQVPFKFYFGAPSCVPATSFESAGAVLDTLAVRQLLEKPEIKYLSEMMNFPGVLQGDKMVMEKIKIAKKLGKPVDGHAPGLRGDDARQYIAAGITTDHECYTREEALEKLTYGMKVLIREGSAAKNFDALIDLLHDFPNDIMFCSDDKHPDSLIDGHINQLCARAAVRNINIFKILKAACLNPIDHYQLEVGRLKPGEPADLIVVEDLRSFRVLQTYINGNLVADKGHSLIGRTKSRKINHFKVSPKSIQDIRYDYEFQKSTNIPVIEALDGQLITNKSEIDIKLLYHGDGYLQSNAEIDILKIVVINRYQEANIAKAFVKNFNLKKGAIASSVAHDSHNIVAVGVDDQSMMDAINLLIQNQGGLCFCSSEDPTLNKVIPLPIAGLMSDRDGFEIAHDYIALNQVVKNAGSDLSAPFMTLSFMALLVIPHIKLSDLGLFDGDNFTFISPIDK
ncbi:MAG: adenine deaminase [Saprospiraceae bacterium]|nr:adenine deaminase [Saprospiraceae bacterium]